MSESEGSNLESLISTPNSSPYQQVPVNESYSPRLSSSDNTLVHSNEDSPHLVILIEPQELFRFRYRSETDNGTHGYLQGECLAPDMTKTYPTVELRNYKGAAIVKCELYQYDRDVMHPHTLYEDSRGNQEPMAKVSEAEGYTVCFKGLGIIHTAKANVAGNLYNKLEKRLKKEDLESLNWRQWCKKIDPNRVRLRFSAHDPTTDKEICSVFSRTILNNKSAETNMLRICRSSRVMGGANGGDDVMLFVEKVNKGHIRVNFFEPDAEGHRIWQAEATILEVHRQCGIYFRTPPYHNKEITKDVKVYMELQRTSDGRCSEPRVFWYTPEPHQLLRKRARKRSATCLESAPVTVQAEITIENQESTPEEITNNEYDFLSDINTEDAMQQENFFGDILSLDAIEAFNEPSKPPPPMEEPFKRPDPDKLSVHQLTDIFIDAPSDNARDFEDFMRDHLNSLMAQNTWGDEGPFMLCSPNMGLDLAKDQPHQIKKPKIQFEMDFGNDSLEIEDSLQIQTLMKEISELKKKKLREWYYEVNEKLDILFEIVPPTTGETILHTMLLSHHEAGLRTLVELLYSLGRRDLLDRGDSRGYTVLHHAVMLDKPDLVTFLLDKGCDPLARSVGGNNALHHAVLCGSALRQLIAGIAAACQCDQDKIDRKLSTRNNDLQTPIFVAVQKECMKSIVMLANAMSSGHVAPDRSGRSPLHVATELDRPDIVRVLLESMPGRALCGGIDIYHTKVRRANYSALQAACVGPQREHTHEIVGLLLDYGANPFGSFQSEPAWRVAYRRGGALWDAMYSRLPGLQHLLPGCPPRDEAGESDDDDYESADDGDSVSSDDIASQLKDIKLSGDQS